jgi:hypothetical protein
MPTPHTDQRLNRDEDQKPGAPPRPATEPAGSHGSSRTDKTMTDPATGAPKPGAPAPNQSRSEDR